MKKIALTVAGVLALLGAGLGISQLAQADDEAPAPSPSASASPRPGTGDRDMREAHEGKGHHDGPRGGRGGHGSEERIDRAALADDLGVTEEQLDTAMQEQRTAERDARLTDLAERLGVDADKLIVSFDQAEQHE